MGDGSYRGPYSKHCRSILGSVYMHIWYVESFRSFRARYLLYLGKVPLTKVSTVFREGSANLDQGT